MKFIEALKSGLPFRKVGEAPYYTRFEGSLIGDTGKRGLSAEDVTEGAWEIAQETLEMSLEDLIAALRTAITDEATLQRVIRELRQRKKK